jgi:hypothetical protein
LETARRKETESRHNFELFKQSLEYKIESSENRMAVAKKAVGEAGQIRAEAQGDLEVVNKDLIEDTQSLNALHHDCMFKASDHEEELKSRNEELNALAEAKKVIKEMTGAAAKDTYGEEGEVSFLQAKSSTSSSSSSTVEAIRSIRKLGKRQNFSALTQMAHKLEAIARNAEISGEDPFGKVKRMLDSMINQLVQQMEAEADHKSHCDKELADTAKSKSLKESAVDKLSTRLDRQRSQSLRLRTEVADLQQEKLEIRKTQQQIDDIRREENERYKKTKPELQMGLEGVKRAMKVLRQYYSQDAEKSHDAQDGAGANIIGVLEVVESDFAKSLATMDAEEETAENAYKKQSEDNELEKSLKEQEVGLKSAQIKSLSKTTAETSTDLDGVQESSMQ